MAEIGAFSPELRGSTIREVRGIVKDKNAVDPAPLPQALLRCIPWASSVRKILQHSKFEIALGGTLVIGSDYSGQTGDKAFEVFSFIVTDGDLRIWDLIRKSVRELQLVDRRRISFKGMSNSLAQDALLPFLEAADYLNGEIVSFVISKTTLNRLPAVKEGGLFDDILEANWKARPLRDMVYKSLMCALIAKRWVPESSNLTWITDHDNFVANPQMLNDSHIVTARLVSAISPEKRGVFAMNTPDGTEDPPLYEDYISIADLMSGALAEFASVNLWPTATFPDLQKAQFLDAPLTPKTRAILDWFWTPSTTLGRICIIVTDVGEKTLAYRLDNLG